jgi:hypothetical protein
VTSDPGEDARPGQEDEDDVLGDPRELRELFDGCDREERFGCLRREGP